MERILFHWDTVFQQLQDTKIKYIQIQKKTYFMYILQNGFVLVNFLLVIQIDKMIKNYIMLGLVSVLIVFGISVSIKCKNLEKEILQLKTEYVDVIDSIKTEKQILEKEVQLLSNELCTYEHQLDSLKQIKQQIVVKYKTQYIISKDLSEGVKTLKENLKCEKYY